jgi:DNA-binding response OmpR family regulator
MKTVLLIEDDASTIFIYKDMLGKNCNLVVAETYQEFLDKISCSPDIVLTDFNFPGGNGNDVATKSRECGVPLVVLQSSDVTARVDISLYDAAFSKSEILHIKAFLRGFLV